MKTLCLTKPSFSIENWRIARDTYRIWADAEKADQKEYSDFRVEDIYFCGLYNPLLHPSLLSISRDGIYEEFLCAMVAGRTPAGVISPLPTLSDHLCGELKKIQELIRGCQAFVYLTETGSCLLLTLIETAPEIENEVSLSQLRQDFQEVFRNLAVPISREVTAVFGESAPNSPNLRYDFNQCFTYMAMVFDQVPNDRAWYRELNRLEDGHYSNMVDHLKLGEVGVNEICLGWGNTIIAARSFADAAFILPAIVAIDGLYQITLSLRDLYIKNSGEIYKPESMMEHDLDALRLAVATLEKELAEIERLDSRRAASEQKFKPWQRGVYRFLSDYWGMDEAIQTMRRTVSNCLARAEAALRIRTAEIEQEAAEVERKQNLILHALVGLQVVSVFLFIGSSIRTLGGDFLEDKFDAASVTGLLVGVLGIFIGIFIALRLLGLNRRAAVNRGKSSRD